jgi:hypothetical protein
VDIAILGIYGQSRPDSGGEGLTGSAWQEIQEQRLDDRYVQTLAETFRDVVGVASDCRVAEIKGPHGIIPSIERLALEIASLIDEYLKKIP